jgi:hypothetical protein
VPKALALECQAAWTEEDGMGLPKIALVAAAGGAAVALGGCSEPAPGPRPPEAPAPASAPGPETTAPPATVDPGGCGTVHTAKGLTLRVEGISGDPASCAEARALLDEVQAHLDGTGAVDGQVSVAVQDWLCVSRPDGAGGTTCSRHNQTLSAQVVPGR